MNAPERPGVLHAPRVVDTGIGRLVPRKEDGWELAASGQDFAVWEKKQ